MLDAAKAAEALIVASGDGAEAVEEMEAGGEDMATNSTSALVQSDADQDAMASPAPSTLSLPASSAADIDISTLTPQTFLVRPTRPDANRNRGKNAFRRKPKPKPPAAAQAEGLGDTTAGEAATTGAPAASVPTAHTTPARQRPQSPEPEDDASDDDPFDEDIVQEMEHLQLALEEAWFLGTALGVLKIYDPISVRPFTDAQHKQSHQTRRDSHNTDSPASLHPTLRPSLAPTHPPPYPLPSPLYTPVSTSSHSPPRRPLSRLLRLVPPLSLARMGRQARYQILVRLAALPQRPRLFALGFRVRRRASVRGPRGQGAEWAWGDGLV